ncbi:MAG: oligosaccharide flippase family protein [Bacteroidetes bacterium]|nr:oligosaccharide flippase family protein [Bacteroidota bacterium]
MVLLNLLIKPFWTIIIEPKVQGQIGDVSYGEYFVIFNFCLLLNIFLDFGLTNFNTRNISQNNHLLSKHLGKLMALKFLMGLGYFVLTFCAGYFIMGFSPAMLFFLSINSFLLSFNVFLRSNLQALHMFKLDSVISVLDRLIQIIILVAMLLKVNGWEVSAMKFVYAQTFGYLATGIICFLTVERKTHGIKFHFDFKFSKLILKKSLPFAILVLLMTFYNRLDSIMIEKILGGNEGKEQSGIYAKSFRLLDAANQIATLFSLQLIPIFSKMLKNKENMENIVKLSYIILVVPSLIISIGTFFYSEYFFTKIYTGDTRGFEILQIIMFCFTAICFTCVFGTLLTSGGKLRQQNIAAIIGIIINFVLNLILIPKYKAYGSAISSLITQSFTAIAQLYLCYKIFEFRINKKIIFSSITFALGLVFINYFTKHLTKIVELNFIVMLTFSAVFAFVSGVVSPKLLKRLFKNPLWSKN